MIDFRESRREARERLASGGEKALSVSLEPGGFVTELRYNRPSAPYSDTGALQSTMSRNELVFACIAVKATAARDPRLTVQTAKRGNGKLEYEEQPGHPFRQLIMRPNDRMTEGDLLRCAIVSWDVSNPRRFYCEKEYKGGLLTAIYPLNPACMQPKYSRANRELIGYVWSDGADRKEYSLDELLIRSAPSWYDPPPLPAALGNTESDSAQTDYIRTFFDNGGIPPGILKYNMPLNDEKRDEIRDKWRSRYGNRFGRSHDIGVLDVNAEWQETGLSLEKLSSPTLRSVAESRICMVFGVPPLIVYAYVGLLRSTYSNLKEAWAGFWDATMSPTFKELRDFWTWNLLTEFEEEGAIRSEQIKLSYDMSQVAALQEDVDGIQTRARANYQAGMMSRDEARSAIGLAPEETERPTPAKGTPAPDQPQATPILGYHIEQGVVSRNEARAQLGLPPEDETADQERRKLQSALSIAMLAVQVGIPLETALPLVGLEVELPAIEPPPPPAAEGGKRRKARTRGSVQLSERRIEKAMQQYLAAEYRKAAEAVA